ncbi:ABC transporter substrate-binding protein [Leminorella grimontii]|uniref:ABC transporter substrate-binding protein n=1 Tax=Leminorella grimontii TaxID=82981 RepID=A0AAV5N496_9GAMM|nr:NrtA/SsuA/CpmA family ABC transporter substrate-binding protein [Leminorella grimontii]KFC94950.1 alkanesulfonates-binding protein [Leminorella grimontii ATCC 33999 = DSM 5078]GKX56916.1 ABC transporter substrate-binding protein [Leminorella grimontii]GKX60861.1 ABC transporter substrate-binding protein [Leminorella grimontii]VFS61151.1 Putative aliphatic sulfonates-binding protein precursor [Leminorella grimontii]
MKKTVLTGALALLLGLSQAHASDKTIDISYVKAPFNLQMMVMKEQGLLEKQAEKLGVTVKWHEITSGAKQAQALASGDLDVAGVMNTSSVLMANGEGNAVKIIAGVSRPTGTFAIVAKKGGVTSIADLKGKKVAGPKGTVLHQTLVAALVKNGLTMKDVQFVQMDIPQAFAALQSGQVDAALLAATSVIKAEQEGAKVLTTADGLVVPKLVMASSEAVVKNHPDWIKAAVAAHDEAGKWIEEHKAEAIALGAKVQGISVEDAQSLFDGSHFTQRMNQGDIDSMKDDVRFMLDNDMMRNSPDIGAIVIPQAMER